ncbi:MAG: hypothetical protein ACREQN_05120 [Candidatus Binataceae bacterium]
MIQTFSSTATGLRASESTAALNGAGAGLANAQARQISFELQDQEQQRQQINHERAVTAQLLDQMALEYDDPILTKVAFWVAAGGDPDFAFKYALAQIGLKTAIKDEGQQTLSIKSAAATAKADAARVEQPAAAVHAAPLPAASPAHQGTLAVPAAVPAGTTHSVPTA